MAGSPKPRRLHGRLPVRHGGLPRPVKALVLGSRGFVGRYLVEALRLANCEVVGWDRTQFDLVSCEGDLSAFDVVYVCAAKSKFIDCEEDRTSYRINVDAPVAIASRARKTVYLSSDAVERALHTNYGMQKALAEVALAGKAVIVRICKRVTKDDLPSLCAYLACAYEFKNGLYRWSR